MERSTTDSPRCTHTDNEGEDDQECLFDFSKERSTTRNGGQQLHLQESPTKDHRRNTREKRLKESQAHRRVKREREREREREWRRRRRERDLELGFWSRVGMHLSCWSCAYGCDSCHVSGHGNQSAPAACRSCTQPLLRTGPALSGAQHCAQKNVFPGARVLQLCCNEARVCATACQAKQRVYTSDPYFLRFTFCLLSLFHRL